MIDECIHHWVIATAQGPTSPGTCQKCHAEREFSNSAAAGSGGFRGNGLSLSESHGPNTPMQRALGQQFSGWPGQE